MEPRRGQLAVHWAPSCGAALAGALGLAELPGPNRFVASSHGDVLWLGPNELLILVAETARNACHAALAAALASGGAVVDVSANRVAFRLSGTSSREVLAASCPIDLDPGRFGPGQLALTLVAGIPVVLQQLEEEPAYRILVRPSYQQFLGAWLNDAITGVVALERLRSMDR